MHVFVVGVNQGLGLKLSAMMAEQGHTVFAGYRNTLSDEASKAARKYPNYKPLELDVTNEQMAKDAAKTIRNDGVQLDSVIIVAGVLKDSDRKLSVVETEIDDLRSALETNVVGTAIVIKHFHSLVKDGGMFLVITSEAGSMTDIGTVYPSYSITKSAQNKLTAIFAKSTTRYSVYAVHPGRMNTEMGREYAQIEPEVSAQELIRILNHENELPSQNEWFIDYKGEAMTI